MGLLQKAVETYDAHEQWVGVPRAGYPTLAPISHVIQNASIEISITSEGKFVNASAIDKKDQPTIIPAFEGSSGRAGTVIAPHPLEDQLCYISGSDDKKYPAYLDSLKKWVDSEFSHPKVTAIYAYISNGTILSDLKYAGLIEVDANGKPDSKAEKMLVRFRVLGLGDPTACWEDPTLFNAFIRYYAAMREEDEPELCMVSGEQEVTAKNHPKGIVSASYGAKLISANDSSGFTYRGRFTEARQAATVGYSASQKAHCALQWVTASSSAVIGGRTFVCWNPQGKSVPKPTDPFSFPEDEPCRTPSDYSEQLKRTISGKRMEFSGSEDVVVAVFDAATTGRLSLTYYSGMKANDFWDRIENWYATCCFHFGKFGIQSPSIRQIANFAFGVQRSSFVECDDRVLREQTQRLLPCVIAGAPIPVDIVRALSARFSQPQAYSQNGHLTLTEIACAVVRKYHNDIAKKEEYTLELEPKKKDRSYQYGRLLAVLEKAERDAYGVGEDREPNAIRMQSVFSERPLYASRVIIEQLKKAYLPRLRPGLRTFYDKLIGEILAEIGADEVEGKLDDTYILGYYLQKNALYTRKSDNEQEEQ